MPVRNLTRIYHIQRYKYPSQYGVLSHHSTTRKKHTGEMTVIQQKPQNLAIQTNPNHDLRVVECEISKLRPDECLVHVRATGICGSDVHFWKHGHIGPMIVTDDNGLGHESAGVVLQVGEEVTRFKPGETSPTLHMSFRAILTHM